jgi:hypothetical protein
VDSGFFHIAYGECSIDSDFPFWGIGGTTYSLVSLRPWQVKEIITKKKQEEQTGNITTTNKVF